LRFTEDLRFEPGGHAIEMEERFEACVFVHTVDAREHFAPQHADRGLSSTSQENFCAIAGGDHAALPRSGAFLEFAAAAPQVRCGDRTALALG
jgi:hypothetical protein